MPWVPTAVRFAVGLALASGGAWLTLATLPVAARGGWQSTSETRFQTSSSAIVFQYPESYAWEADTWTESEVAERYRLEAESPGGQRLFVGLTSGVRVLAPPPRDERHRRDPCRQAAKRAYLAGATYDVVDHPEQSKRDGRVVPSPPSTRRIWASSALGSHGTIDLSARVPTDTFETSFPPLAPRVECGGDAVAVVMNADGSPGVAADVRFGSRILAFSLVATAVSVAIVLTGFWILVRAIGDYRGGANRAVAA